MLFRSEEGLSIRTATTYYRLRKPTYCSFNVWRDMRKDIEYRSDINEYGYFMFPDSMFDLLFFFFLVSSARFQA